MLALNPQPGLSEKPQGPVAQSFDPLGLDPGRSTPAREKPNPLIGSHIRRQTAANLPAAGARALCAVPLLPAYSDDFAEVMEAQELPIMLLSKLAT